MILFRNAVLLLAAAIAPRALASEARMETLKSSPGITDETDVFAFPGAISEYNLALVELGTANNVEAYGGVLKRVGKMGLGVVVSREEMVMTAPGLSTISLVDDWLARAASNDDAKAILPSPERPVEVLLGMDVGGGNLGFKIGFATYRDERETTTGATDKDDAKAEQVDVGVGYSTGNADNRTDVGFHVGALGTVKRTRETAATETSHSYKRGAEMVVSVRNLGKMGQGRRFVGASILTRSPEVKADNGTTDEEKKFKEQGVNLQGGYVMLPAANVSVSAGLGLLYFKSQGPIIATNTGVGSTGTTPATPSILASPDDDVKKTTNILYSDLAVEAPVTESIGILGGMRYMFYGSTKTEDGISAGEPKTEESVDETPDVALWSLGLFYAQGPMRLDATYTKEFLHSGPYLLTGDVTNNVFGRISLTYKI